MKRNNKVVSLFKTLLNVTWGLSYMRYYYFKKRERLWELPLIVFSILVLVVMFGVGIGVLSDYLYKQLAPLGQQHVILTLGIIAAQLMVLLMGIVFVISTFYFSGDLRILVSLPFRWFHIISSKFAIVVVNEYVSLVTFIAPIFVVYGMREGAGLSYILTAIGTFILLPLLPLAISSALAFILMRFVNLTAKKELFTMIGGIALILVVLAMQYFLQTQPGEDEMDQFLYSVLVGEDGLARLIGERFPPSLWATRALAGAGTSYGLQNLLLFVGVSIGACFAAVAIGERIFHRSLLMGMEADNRSGRARRAMSFAMRSPVASVAINEWRLFIRKAVFVLNGLAGLVIFPVLLFITLLTGGEGMDDLSQLLEYIDIPLIASLVCAAYVVMQTGMSGLPATTFSREGRLMAVLRTQPFKYREVFLGKLLSIQVLLIFGSIPGIIVLGMIAQVSFVYPLVGFIIGGIASTALSVSLMLVDLARPMLRWNNPTQAMKSNINTMIGLVIVMGVIAGGVFLYRFFDGLGLSAPVIMALMGAVSGVWCVASLNVAERMEHLWWQRDL